MSYWIVLYQSYSTSQRCVSTLECAFRCARGTCLVMSQTRWKPEFAQPPSAPPMFHVFGLAGSQRRKDCEDGDHHILSDSSEMWHRVLPTWKVQWSNHLSWNLKLKTQDPKVTWVRTKSSSITGESQDHNRSNSTMLKVHMNTHADKKLFKHSIFRCIVAFFSLHENPDSYADQVATSVAVKWNMTDVYVTKNKLWYCKLWYYPSR